MGGSGFQSNFEWQAVGVYSYAWQFTGYQLAALIGYRALGVNYTNTGNNNSVDLVLHGPIIGFSIRFRRSQDRGGAWRENAAKAVGAVNPALAVLHRKK